MSTTSRSSGAGRYAPSPSGALHLGNLRTALVAWLMARTTGRAFLLRIEDIDVARSSPAVAAQQISDLIELGLDFDPPRWHQSERLDRYRSAIASLGPDRTYDCFCTRREIADAVRAPHARVGQYPGTCAHLSTQERDRLRQHRPAAVRIRAEGVSHTITDQWAGEVTEVVDDFVVQRNDGAPAYNLAVVLDDAESGVDQVVRGADLVDSAPRQAWLATQLGWGAPSYAHVPLVLNEAGQRLAKRDGAVTLESLAAQGKTMAEVRRWLALSLGLAEPGEPVTLSDLLDRFDPATLPRAPWIYRGSAALER